jgi:hypothetical protein
MFIVSGERPIDDRLTVSIFGYLVVVEASRAKITRSNLSRLDASAGNNRQLKRRELQAV